MFKWTNRFVLSAVVAALLVSNILTLTNAAFNTAVSGLLTGTLGVRTLTDTTAARLAAKNAVIKRQTSRALRREVATRRFGTRLAARTRKVAAKSIAAIPAEAIPFLGVAVLVADTSYELYAACTTVKDMDALYVQLGIDEQTPDDVMHSLCHPQLPDPGDVWTGVMEKSGEWLQQAKAAM